MTTNDPRTYDTAQDISHAAQEFRAGLSDLDKEVIMDAARTLSNPLTTQLTEALQAGKRAFVSPTHLNSRILIVRGKLETVYTGTKVKYVAGSAAPAGVENRRLGDVWVRFSGGIVVIDPEHDEDANEKIAWALNHPEICRDAMDPATEVWASMKSAQQQTSKAEPSLPENLDVDAVLRGDLSGFNESNSIAARARRQLASSMA